jgi:hypothetical protein
VHVRREPTNTRTAQKRESPLVSHSSIAQNIRRIWENQGFSSKVFDIAAPFDKGEFEAARELAEVGPAEGRERGSWDPRGDRWGDAGGRLYVTCLSICILEVYQRHLPLYQTGLYENRQ